MVYAVRRRRRSKLPPGPPRLPLLGNLLQAPKASPWILFQKWAQEYGPLVSVDFGGTIVILISDYDIAKELLDKRASTYSARPRMVMASELICKDQHILLRQPNARYVLHQRLEAPVFSPRAAPSYEPIQDMESKVLLHNLLESNDIRNNFEIYAASIAYLLMYGFRILTNDEWQMHTAHAALDDFVHAAQPGSWLVDSMPLLKYLPAFIAPFKRQATAFYKRSTNLYMRNLEQGLRSKSWNWAKDFAAAKEATQMSEEELAWDVGVLQDAAIETSDVFLKTFTLACVSHPDFISRAQNEIDEVVGCNGSRMPDFPDLSQMPYVHAIIEEVFRWRHVMPAGVAHATSKDDWYNGYLIPKGATIIPLWKAMREDHTRYENPMEFRPDRWLKAKGQLNNWGYGRRICAGRHIAKNTITIAVARILWAFHVRPADGKKVVVDESMFTGGFASHPKGFEVSFEPRSEMHRMTIEGAYERVEKDPETLMARVWNLQVKSGLKPRST
ncbi:cytochrome P450 [Periconia macrospinosa]|uniref:Cytochrome P450 n=1 Tax=Periconia macrospinosa TaxID=97972 RepID=A0A2V1DG47_9PLEO|nr:cytochrome P450 [Periconia macrospinosa]